MKKPVLLGIAVAVAVAGIGFAIRSQQTAANVAPRPDRGATAPTAPAAQTSETARADAALRAEPDPVDSENDDPIARAERRIAAARLNHQRALAAIADAERELLESEREIEELERYVADLEARGEDPAKHSFEGMELFNPVLDRFQPRVEALEQAESEEASSRAALQAAEARLAGLRAGASSSDRP